MKQSITQETDYGCGIACFAFSTEMSFSESAHYLGCSGKTSEGVPLKILFESMNRYGLTSVRKYTKAHLAERIKEEGTIVLTKRSNDYPVGHYLVRHNNKWMDPWITMLDDGDLKHAESGYRDELPGEAMYAILPIEI